MENFFYGFAAAWFVFGTILFLSEWFGDFHSTGVRLDKGWITYLLCLPWVIILMPWFVINKLYVVWKTAKIKRRRGK